MAFVQTSNDPNAQQPGNPQSPMNQPPVTASGTGAGATGAPSGGSSAVPASTQAPPVQDLKAYLSANAPQAVGMGQTIAGGLNQEYQTAAGDINAAKTAQDQAVQAGSVTPNSDLVSQAAANPTQFVQNQQNVNDFLAQENAAYTGPTADTATSAINAVNIPTAPDINQPGGVRQLVTGMETNPTYGMENLDELIMQGNPAAMAPVQEAIPKFQTLAPQQASAITGTQNAIQKALADAEAARTGVSSAFTGEGGVVPKFQQTLSDQLTAANKSYTDVLNQATPLAAQNQAIKNALSGGKALTPEQAKLLGVDPNIALNAETTQSQDISDYINSLLNAPAYGNFPGKISDYMRQENIAGIKQTGGDLLKGKLGNELYNILSSLLSPGSINAGVIPTFQNTATGEQYAEAKALEELLGAGSVGNFDTSLGSQAGTFNANAVNPSINKTELDALSSYLSGLPGKISNQKLNLIDMGYSPTGVPSWGGI